MLGKGRRWTGGNANRDAHHASGDRNRQTNGYPEYQAKLVRAEVHTPVLATLAYVMSPDGLSTLLMHRNKRPDDIHFGKYVGLGGRLEREEHITDGAVREIQEESGLVATGITLRGTISWPGFGKGGQDWFGFVFRVDSFTGQAHGGNKEGTLQWVPIKDLPEIPMWKSDFEWLPMVFDNDPRQFHGVMPYLQGEMVSWSYLRS